MVVRRLRDVVQWFIRRFGENTLSVHAAHVVFFVMVSFFPFVMFFFTLLRYTPLTEENIIMLLEAVVPEGIRGVLEAWIQEAYHQSSGTILSITVITTLWSGSKGFMGITYGLDKIYQVKNQRNWVVNRLSSLLYTLAFAGILMLSLIVLVYGNKILLAVDSFFPLRRHCLSGFFPCGRFWGLVSFFCSFYFCICLFRTGSQMRRKRFRALCLPLFCGFCSVIYFQCMWIIFTTFPRCMAV